MGGFPTLGKEDGTLPSTPAPLNLDTHEYDPHLLKLPVYPLTITMSILQCNACQLSWPP